jgi:signal transduction histidine kinase
MSEPNSASQHRWRFGLRYKVALLFGIPILFIAMLIMFIYYVGEKKEFEQLATNTSIQMSSMILAGMKHTMMVNDRTLMQEVLTDTGQQGDISRIWVIDPDGVVQLSTDPSEVKTRLDTQAMGCIECHQYPPGSRPQAQRINHGSSMVRIITPINRDPECTSCHTENVKHLGVLLTDVSLAATESQLMVRLRQTLLLTLGLTALAVFVAIIMANLLVIRRIEVMQRAMSAFENGDYSVRITHNWRSDDEFTRLADSFNHLVDSISRHRAELEKITQVRQQAIMDERERIARELHDGVAQFLGYINTKIMAISTLLAKNESHSAQKHIDQIMQAVHDQSVDVRASIVGLKLAESGGDDLAGNLREYIRQCNLLLDLPVELEVEPQAENIRLNPEVELHLVRIVQEAISNIRKHAQANFAQVKLAIAGDMLVLTVHDDGIGFNPWQMNIDNQPHFGLQTMRERAELAGAQLSLVSEPGVGTTVTLQLRLEAA